MDNHTPEIWKTVVGYEGLYSVSNYGRIRCDTSRNRYPAGLIREGNPNQDGYLRISLTKHGQRKKWFIHQLVAFTFIGEIRDGYEVNHINGVKTDNRVSNLEIVTHRANMHHAQENALWNPGSQYGEKNYNAKLDCQRVEAIRTAYATGNTSYPKLAKQYGVSHQLIRAIVKRDIWKHC